MNFLTGINQIKVPPQVEIFCRNLSKDELFATIDLIFDYRPISKTKIKKNLSSAKAIVISKINDTIIGTATLKISNDIYSDNAFLKAESDFDFNDFSLELGYMVVSPNFRKLGIASKMVSLLCSNFEDQNIFAVTNVDNKGSIDLKLKIGFEPTGKEFKDRKSQNFLRLFIKRKIR